MELEKQDDDDDKVAIMDLGSGGKTDGSQTDNQMTSSSPLKEGPTAAESITNKKSGENQQPYEESGNSKETKESQTEAINKDNHSKEGGRGGRG